MAARRVWAYEAMVEIPRSQAPSSCRDLEVLAGGEAVLDLGLPAARLSYGSVAWNYFVP